LRQADQVLADTFSHVRVWRLTLEAQRNDASPNRPTFTLREARRFA
jgi:hypothetical protein